MSRGVVMLAVGNEHFGKLCVNFAISAKYQSPNYHFCLITTEKIYNRLDGKHKELFDVVSFINPETYHVNGSPDYGLAKLRIYEHAPFDENLYVDADSLMSMYGKLETVFDKVAPFKFYILNNHNAPPDSTDGISIWGNVNQFQELGLKAPVATGTQSSLIYFEKGAGTIGESVFENALETHAFITAGNASASKVWYNSVPDELCFSIGSSMANFEHQASWFDLAVMRGSFDRMIDHEGTHRACQIITFPSGMGNVTRATSDFYNGVLFHFTRHAKIRPATMWVNKKSIPRVNEIESRVPFRR